MTLLFSSTSYPTANIFFPNVCQIKLALMEWLNSSNSIIHQIVTFMVLKFYEYWGVISGVMAKVIVLDLMDNIDLSNYFFPKIYGDQSDCEIEKVNNLFKDLVREYEMNMKGKKLVSSCPNPNINVCQSVDGRKDGWMRDLQNIKLQRKVNHQIISWNLTRRNRHYLIHMNNLTF